MPLTDYHDMVKAFPPKRVKAELSCPENTEVRCPLFTDTCVR
jgi:hypothetical protein